MKYFCIFVAIAVMVQVSLGETPSRSIRGSNFIENTEIALKRVWEMIKEAEVIIKDVFKVLPKTDVYETAKENLRIYLGLVYFYSISSGNCLGKMVNATEEFFYLIDVEEIEVVENEIEEADHENDEEEANKEENGEVEQEEVGLPPSEEDENIAETSDILEETEDEEQKQDSSEDKETADEESEAKEENEENNEENEENNEENEENNEVNEENNEENEENNEVNEENNEENEENNEVNEENNEENEENNEEIVDEGNAEEEEEEEEEEDPASHQARLHVAKILKERSTPEYIAELRKLLDSLQNMPTHIDEEMRSAEFKYSMRLFQLATKTC